MGGGGDKIMFSFWHSSDHILRNVPSMKSTLATSWCVIVVGLKMGDDEDIYVSSASE